MTVDSDKQLRETRLRSIFKAITYRITGTITTTVIVFAVTGELAIAAAVGVVEPAVKLIVYYLHERAWQHVPTGTIRRLFLQQRGAKTREE
ncbi:MAG TPA: DUF2061 domain-containing protein [Woeseiaceae bacterium]|nr:DUF2061 domain-containing protein [Woeseiaceae bacterium]